MRTEKALKNSILSVISQIIILALAFLNRKIFISYLDILYLGYESLFTNIFNLLNITELGIGGIITFHLYKELASDNKEGISKLMILYRTIYRFIAIIVFILGIAIFFVLPFIIKDEITDWNYIRIIYLIQLAGTVANFFLAYNRTIFIADQKEYKIIKIDLYCKIIVQVLQILAIVIFKSFILYLLFKSFCLLIANVIVSLYKKKEYKYINKKSIVTREDIKEWNIISDTKNFIVHKIAYVIYSGTDNIVISSICGLKYVALYGNYYLIQNNVMNLIVGKMLNPIQASIGDFVYKNKNISKQKDMFYMLDLFSSILSSYVTIAFLILFQPFISLWIGNQYLLSFGFVVSYCIIVYLTISYEMLYKYRSVFGDYYKDKKYMVLAAILNIIISIFLANKIGIVGINIGTIIGLLPIIYGRMKFVVSSFLKDSIKTYIKNHMLYTIIDVIKAIIIMFICLYIPNSIIGLSFKVFVFIIINTVLTLIIYGRKKEFLEIKKYILIIINSIKNKTNLIHKNSIK